MHVMKSVSQVLLPAAATSPPTILPTSTPSPTKHTRSAVISSHFICRLLCCRRRCRGRSCSGGECSGPGPGWVRVNIEVANMSCTACTYCQVEGDFEGFSIDGRYFP